ERVPSLIALGVTAPQVELLLRNALGVAQTAEQNCGTTERLRGACVIGIGGGEFAVAVDRALGIAALALGLEPVELGLAARFAVRRFSADGGQLVLCRRELAQAAAS